MLATCPKTFRALEIEYNPKRDYVFQWNLNLQRQLPSTWSATLAYVGSKGNHQPFHTTEADEAYPTDTSAGWLYAHPLGTGTRINPNFGDIKALYWMATSNYNGLITSLTKRLDHGLQVSAAFTWQRSLDDDSSSQEGNGFTNAPAAPNYYDLRGLWYGPSDFNITRVFVLNATLAGFPA